VLLVLIFISWCISQEKRKEWDFWWFTVCFKWALKKRVFFGWSNYMNSGDNYGRLVDSLSQMSKLFYFNVLDLADFMMYH